MHIKKKKINSLKKLNKIKSDSSHPHQDLDMHPVVLLNCFVELVGVKHFFFQFEKQNKT